jgi:hypothetical protein
MNKRTVHLIWGTVLILAGLLFLAQNMAWLPTLSTLVWAAISFGLSLLFLVSFLISRPQEIGWLFPGFIFAGTGVTLSLVTYGVQSDLLAVPVLLGVALPFLVVFLLDRQKNGWALIPAWVMLALIAVVFLSTRVSGEVVGAVVMFSIGLPFLFVFLRDRSQWWGLIPGLILSGMGVVILLVNQAGSDYIASLILFVIALPFLLVFLWSRDNWWGLIPAGILTSIGTALLLFGRMQTGLRQAALLNAVILAGWALTFGILWLLRGSRPTGWARYPALALGVGAIIAVVFGASFRNLWPIIIILIGLLMIVFSLGSQSSQKEAQEAQSLDESESGAKS